MLTAFTPSVWPEQQGRLLSPGLRTVAGGVCGPLLAWGPCLLQSKELGVSGSGHPQRTPSSPVLQAGQHPLPAHGAHLPLRALTPGETTPKPGVIPAQSPPTQGTLQPYPTPKSAFLSWDSPDLTPFTHFLPYQLQCSVKRERGRVLEMPPTPGSLPEETRAHLPSLRAPCTQFLNVILFRRQYRPEAETQ